MLARHNDLHQAAVTAVAVVGGWLVLAAGYCYLHGVLAPRDPADVAVSIAWSLNQWGSWLVIAPVLVVAAHSAWPHASRLSLLVLAAFALSVFSYLALETGFAGGTADRWRFAYLFLPRGFALLAFVLAIEAARVGVSRRRSNRAARPMLETTAENGDKFLILKDRIRFLRAAGNYVEVEDGVQTARIRSTLRDVEASLDPQRFLRVHRSFIVNLELVQCVERARNSRRSWIRLKGVATRIPVSAKRLEALAQRSTGTQRQTGGD